MTTIDVLMPARDEAPTVAENVTAALECRHVRDVIVIDDGSVDGTADIAAAAGAKVIAREGSDKEDRSAGIGCRDTSGKAVSFVTEKLNSR